MSQKLDTQTRGHHPDSPSSLQSSEACALFENEQRDSVAGEVGTLQHKATETRDSIALEKALDKLGLSAETVDDKIEGVRIALEYEDAQRRRFRDAGIPFREIAEKYFPVGDDRVEDYVGVTGGFPDNVLLSAEQAIVLDWKFGKIPVTETRENLQGIAYALGVFQAYPTVQEVEVHFFHPHQNWSQEEQERKYVAVFGRPEIPALELRVRTVVARKRAAGLRLKSSIPADWADAVPKHDLCIWCARKGDCKTLHAKVIKAASKHPDFLIPTEVNHLALTRAEQVTTAFLWATQLTSIATSVKKRAADMVLTEGLELGDNIKLVKRTERFITSPVKLVRLAIKHRIGLLSLFRAASISVSKLESAVKARAPKGGGAAAVRQFQSELEESGISKKAQPIYFLQEAKAPKEKNKDILEIEANAAP